MVENGKQIPIIYCHKCDYRIKTEYAKITWDEHGYGYSTKLAICPNCASLNPIQYIEDPGLDVNNDSRFYL